MKRFFELSSFRQMAICFIALTAIVLLILAGNVYFNNGDPKLLKTLAISFVIFDGILLYGFLFPSSGGIGQTED
ncbi:hypothetical protein [Sphingomonas prati]|uniref:Uncharacterized protein n=1 Tax=Sphingomonas prati TaxID=1843237 RepID=A0A7W9F2X6_9SPHN|nr:hypothetical protein [Sphingomonas prati]MBB5730878.1 hypothetical protein [Sphingomonas prati]